MNLHNLIELLQEYQLNPILRMKSDSESTNRVANLAIDTLLTGNLFHDNRNAAFAKDIELSGDIRTDNRLIQKGDIFICIKGFSVDGHFFAKDAIQKGAALIIHETDITEAMNSDFAALDSDASLRHLSIQVTDTRKAAALAVRMRYDDPSAQFCLIGITGTNGKTTISTLIYQALSELGYKCGLIGTLGYYIDQEHYPTKNTTPDIVELNKIFLQMIGCGVTHVIMEVSSHALALERVYGLHFDYTIFSNLSRDHLDFHRSFEEYGAAKFRLFSDNPDSVALINTDDKWGKSFYDKLKETNATVYSISEAEADFEIYQANTGISGSTFELLNQGKNLKVSSSLIGAFNIYNLSTVMACLQLLGIESEKLTEIAPKLKAPAGRFEAVPNYRGIGVFIDYAHTPEALENVLRTADAIAHSKTHTAENTSDKEAFTKKPRVLCLIGAGGDRDRGKRPLMLKIAMTHSDAVIITDDNPRTEDPNQIIKDIIRDTNIWLPWWIIRDRREAINAILRLAQPQDIVLICGKGHENYQEIQGIRHHFDDFEVAREYLENDDNYSYKPDDDDLILPVDPMLLELINDSQFSSDPEQTQPFFSPDAQSGSTSSAISYQNLHRLCLDSRQAKPNSIYVAIKGENFDGHDFVQGMLADQSCVAIGEKALPEDSRYLMVDNSLNSLGAFCRKYLLMFSPYKVALTGSTGKTTTKEMIYQMLSHIAPTLKSVKNENNIIGLCKTILKIKPWHEYAVFELGTNHFGEIAAMSDICFPDCGMILNIGPSHLEFFGDEDGVFSEKSSLFERPLLQRVYPSDDDRFIKYKHQGVSVGFAPEADYRISQVVSENGRTDFLLNDVPYSIPYEVSYFTVNAAFTIALGSELGIHDTDIRKAMEQAPELSMRMQILQNADQKIIVDCYNANPVSLLNAIEHWAKTEMQRPHIAILGDMLELGESSMQYHQMMGAVLSEKEIEILITVGKDSIYYHPDETQAGYKHYATVEELAASGVINSFPENSYILLKGSHGIHLEKLLPLLIKEEA